MHWRARTLSRWTGHGWRAAEGDIPRATPLRPRPRPGLPSSLVTAEVEVVGMFADGIVFTPEGWPLSVIFRGPGSRRPPSQRLYRNAAGDLFYQPVDGNDLRYQVVVDGGAPGLLTLRGRGQGYPASVAPDLEVPADLDPRVRALARGLGGDKDPADAAAAIERWLTTALKYTRELPGAVPDPVADFLFARRAGHCELFSSAMVLMLRSLGIPARNVTGYFGGRSTAAGYYAVRAGDAHSWVEAYFPEVGFVPFDPTPPSGRGSLRESPWARMVLLWDTLQQRWRAFIVDYDLIAQTQAMRRVGQIVSETGRRLAGKGGGAARLRAAAEVALALLLAGGLLVAVRRVRGRRRPGATAALGPDQRRALRLWRSARNRLRQAGIEVAANGTPRELARTTPALEELVSAYARVRWGGARLSFSEARALLRRLEGRLELHRIERRDI